MGFDDVKTCFNDPACNNIAIFEQSKLKII